MNQNAEDLDGKSGTVRNDGHVRGHLHTALLHESCRFCYDGAFVINWI